MDNGTGLYVYNPDNAGTAYYAVTAVVDGVENRVIGTGNISSGVSEIHAQGTPVLQRVEEVDSFQYINNVDKYYYVRWEAPPNASIKGQPYDYLVAVPSNLQNPAPVGIHLHCWGGYLDSGYGWWNDGLQGKILLASNQKPYDWWTGYHEFMYTENASLLENTYQADAADRWNQGVVTILQYRQNVFIS